MTLAMHAGGFLHGTESSVELSLFVFHSFPASTAMATDSRLSVAQVKLREELSLLETQKSELILNERATMEISRRESPLPQSSSIYICVLLPSNTLPNTC